MYFSVYKSDQNNQYYWYMASDNHKKIADGAEGYHNKTDCINGIKLVKANAAAAGIWDAELKKWI
jgi:uncharacterized protein